MANTYKVLAQSNPGAASLTDIYTVPGATSTIVSTIIVCNQAASAASFRVSLQVANAADNPKQYLYYDLPIAGNDTFIFTLGITLAATDVISVYASSTTLSFNVVGVEIT
jgi:hypothetical protein